MTGFSPWRSVRGRLLMLAIAVEAVMLTVLVANSLRLLTDNMGEQARRHAAQMAPVLIAAITAPLAQRDYATVQAVLDESLVSEGIDYLAVVDRAGKRVAASGLAPGEELPAADRAFWAFRLFGNNAAKPRYDVAEPVVLYGQPLGELHFGLDLSQIAAAHRQLLWQGAGIAAVEIVLSAGLMALLGFFLTRHLTALTRASRAVAEGNMTPPPVPEGSDDVGRLGAAFNAMSRAVAERIRELTEARDRQAELAQAAAAAAEAKAAFLATMSHEIRTPMNGIMGMTDLALATELTDEQREYLTWVKASAESLLAVLNDILDFSKIDAGHMRLEAIPFVLDDVFEGVVRLFAVQAAEKGLRLDWRAEGELPGHLVGDPTRLRQILANLLSNAIKFTERGGIDVVVRALPAAGDDIRLRFTVSDTGIGISPDKQALIFAPFVQAESHTTRQYGGTGLGLAIVARLVGLMRGEIRVDSAPGRGSAFHVDLPLRPAPAPGPAQSAGPAADAPAAAGARILLVEDTPVNQRLGDALLTRHGYRVTLAADGQEALDLCRGESFDLILMDIHMPRLDGLAATRALRAREAAERRAPTPIVALTADVLEDDRRECLAAGMNGFIGKPFRAEDMLAEIGRHLAACDNPSHSPGQPA